MQRLALLEQAQWWPRERLHAKRDELLRTLVEVAYREVPLYHELMSRAHVTPADIHIQTLHKFPIVTKDMIRAHFPSRATRQTGQKTYDSRSSGSTVRPFCVQRG